MSHKIYTLITGSSEGFGKSLALECASRKMNLILVALPGPALERLADFIKLNYDVDVKYFGLDLSIKESVYELYRLISEEILEVNMIINNAGIGSTQFFSEANPDFYERQIQLNILTTTLITYTFLPLIKKNSRSYILNVSSLASFFCVPRKCVYGATKSFIYSFSRSLSFEEKKNGVQVSVLCPAGMNTNLSITLLNKGVEGITKWTTMEPETVARMSITALLNGREVIVPGRINRLFIIVSKWLPYQIKKWLILNGMKSVQPQNAYATYL